MDGSAYIAYLKQRIAELEKERKTARADSPNAVKLDDRLYQLRGALSIATAGPAPAGDAREGDES